MFALIPCPNELRSGVMSCLEHADKMEGFWFVTQNPSVIANAGSQARIGDSVDEIVQTINVQAGLPYGYSLLRKNLGHSYDWDPKRSCNRYNSTTGKTEEDKDARKSVDSAALYEKTNDNYPDWIIYSLLPCPELQLKEFNEYDVLAEAQRQPKGILVSLKFGNLNWEWDRFQVMVYKENYILERTSFGYQDAEVGLRLVYNPSRAKRLASRRKNYQYVGRMMPRLTCYNLSLGLLQAMRKVVSCDAINCLYRESWRGRGINNVTYALVNFIALARLMRRYNLLLRRCLPVLRELWLHRSMLEKLGTPVFWFWYKTVMKKIGEPTNPEKYKTVVKPRGSVT